MNELPDLHDGFFDGLWLSENSARLFVRSATQVAYSIVLSGMERLRFCNVRQGNVILDFCVIPTEQLSPELIEEAYDSATDVAKLLNKAREQALLAVELSTSYGAEGVALCRTLQIVAGHLIPLGRPSSAQ